MKRILTAAAALLFSAAMFAQSNDGPPPLVGGHPQGGQQMGGGRPPMSPEQRAKREADNINSIVPLGDAYQKVLDVSKQDGAKRESIMNGAKRNELTDDQKSQLRALNEAHKANLKAAMGPDLYKKYEDARKAQMDQRRNGSGDGQGPPPGN